jgi:type II secretory pathway component GspD/PulD (secretin)
VNSTENKKADEKANPASRLDSIPTEFASSGDVRKFIQELRDAGRLRSLRQLRLSALDGQNASAQVGTNKPQVTGSNYSPRGGRANSVTFRQIGTTIEARPSIDSEKRIRVQFEYNMSDLQKSNDVTLVDDGDGKTLFADEIVTRQFKTTARLRNGTASVIRCDSSIASGDKSEAGRTELIILCGAIANE